MGTLATTAVNSLEATRSRAVRPLDAESLGITRLASALFSRQGAAEQTAGRTVLLTSARRREGVSTITRMLALQLAGDAQSKVLLMTLDDLDRMRSMEAAEIDRVLFRNHATNLWNPSRESSGVYLNQAGAFAGRVRALNHLKSRFDCILLDAPAVQQSDAVLEAAPLADSVLLVVAAGRTRRSQIRYAHQVIVAAGAVVAGCCLNRRTYPIPAFLYRWFGR